MVRSDGTFQDVNFLCTANLADDFPQPKAYLVFQHFLAVFGDPDYVEFVIVEGMGRPLISSHTASILKSWAEAQSVPLGVDINPGTVESAWIKLLRLIDKTRSARSWQTSYLKIPNAGWRNTGPE